MDEEPLLWKDFTCVLVGSAGRRVSGRSRGPCFPTWARPCSPERCRRAARAGTQTHGARPCAHVAVWGPFRTWRGAVPCPVHCRLACICAHFTQAEGGVPPGQGPAGLAPLGRGSFWPSLRQGPPLSASRGEGLRTHLSPYLCCWGLRWDSTVEEKGLIFTVF